jgi:hypothetical protein
MALPSNRYYALAVPSVTGIILAFVVLAVVMTCRQYCAERRRRRLAVKQQQQLLLLRAREGERSSGTPAAVDGSMEVESAAPGPATKSLTVDRQEGVMMSWDDKPATGSSCKVALNCSVDGTTRQCAMAAVADAQLQALAECSVDAVLRRAVHQPYAQRPVMTDRWRSSGRQARSSTPRTLKRATTDVALWTLSSTSTSTLTAQSPPAASDFESARWQRHWKQIVAADTARQLSRSVPVLETSSMINVKSARFPDASDVAVRGIAIGSDVTNNDVTVTTDRKHVGARRPSTERLRPITVEGVTTFPVCPTVIVRSAKSACRCPTDAYYVPMDNMRIVSNRSRQNNFLCSRSVQSNDNFLDGISASCVADDNNGNNGMVTWQSMTSFRYGEFPCRHAVDGFFMPSSTYCDPLTATSHPSFDCSLDSFTALDSPSSTVFT